MRRIIIIKYNLKHFQFHSRLTKKRKTHTNASNAERKNLQSLLIIHNLPQKKKKIQRNRVQRANELKSNARQSGKGQWNGTET